MKNLSLKNILSAVDGKYQGSASALTREITSVTKDSREVTCGCLFAAIKGENSDGHDYIVSAEEQGALCALGQRVPEGCGCPVIVVPDTVRALGDLAAFYRKGFDIPVVGITGSVGKTTTKEMVSAVLAQHFKVHKTTGNHNNELGVPLTVLGIGDDTEAAVIEMGISHFGEMTRLAEIVHPDMAVYTTIGSAHLEYLGDLDGVLKAKTELLPLMREDGVVFINGDDPYLCKISCLQKICRYGINKNCDVLGENIRLLGTEGMEMEIVSCARRIAVRINSYGIHLVTAALAAAAVGIELGLTDGEISDGIASFTPVGSRAGIIKTESLTIVDDCYNANPTSTDAALKSLGMLTGRKVAILGDMLELGANEKKLHFITGVHSADSGVDLVISCGDLSQNTVEGARSTRIPARWYESKQALIAALPYLLEPGDAVLVKASHSCRFEDIVETLKVLHF
ncbi:MAG: UDP-N-acetylmuramoyl-tripeptide--D-alanyl-D-alanine ligase [Clostridia bacterium]|nr:UDP-N-acetylmuramoyl-tripeptide--D-alanyl-D-alanine ligase [Clostridia bacterium]